MGESPTFDKWVARWKDCGSGPSNSGQPQTDGPFRERRGDRRLALFRAISWGIQEIRYGLIYAQIPLPH
jgi:hypothetical protein